MAGRYVDAKTVVENSKQGGGGGRHLFNLPEGVEEWLPDKAGTFMIDVLPYEVTQESHPDRIGVGYLWYKRPFQIHYGVGPMNETVVCPKSIAKKCPICDEAARLKNTKDVAQEVLDSMGYQKFLAYNIRHPEDRKRIALFALSYGKFQKALDKEIEEGPETIRGFYHCDDSGHTLQTRFSEETFLGKKFLAASRIDFLPRKALNEAAFLEAVVKLDDCFQVYPYEKLKKLFFQMDAEDAETPSERPTKGTAVDPGDDDTPAPRKQASVQKQAEPEEVPDAPAAPAPTKAKAAPVPVDEDVPAPVTKKQAAPPPVDDDVPAPRKSVASNPAPVIEATKIEVKATTPPKSVAPASAGKDTPTCPAEAKGGVFGKTCDKFGEDCDSCKVWTECDRLTGLAK